jgi:hypothetical protein
MLGSTWKAPADEGRGRLRRRLWHDRRRARAIERYPPYQQYLRTHRPTSVTSLPSARALGRYWAMKLDLQLKGGVSLIHR